MNFLLTFADIYSSLECRNAFKRAGIPCDIDTVPARFGLPCGYAVRCEAPDTLAIDTILSESGVSYSNILTP